MNPANAECQRCRLYETEVILLRAEIAGLRNSVLHLSKPADAETAVLEITGMHEPERFSMAGPIVSGTDVFYRVALSYRDHLSARCALPIDDPGSFLKFFEDLAQHKHGWEGEKSIACREGQLVVTCRYEGKMFRPGVSMDVICALEIPSFDPYWSVQLHLDVDPESLDHLLAQAKIIFSPDAAASGGGSE